jgi:hypothetical protein
MTTKSLFDYQPAKNKPRWPWGLMLVASAAAAWYFHPTLRTVMARFAPTDQGSLQRDEQLASLPWWGPSESIDLTALTQSLIDADTNAAHIAFEDLRKAQQQWPIVDPNGLIEHHANLTDALAAIASKCPSERRVWLRTLLAQSMVETVGSDEATSQQAYRAATSLMQQLLDESSPSGVELLSATVVPLTALDASPEDMPTAPRSVSTTAVGVVPVQADAVRAPSITGPGTATPPPSLLSPYPERTLIDLLGSQRPAVASQAAQELADRGVGAAELTVAQRIATGTVEQRRKLAAWITQHESIDQQRCLQWLKDDRDRITRQAAIEAIHGSAPDQPTAGLEALGQQALGQQALGQQALGQQALSRR